MQYQEALQNMFGSNSPDKRKHTQDDAYIGVQDKKL